MIKKANVQWSIKTLVKMAKGSKLSFDNAVQRGYCWDKGRKSLLIHSVLEGFPIPAFYAAKVSGDSGAIYDMLDGKQRSGTLVSYLSDEFALGELPEVTYENTEGDVCTIDVSGMKFSELPEDLQDAISDYSLTVYYFDGITDEEIAELFYRLNNGQPLSAITLTRVKTKSKGAIHALSKHELFSTILTDSALNKFVHEEIILKTIALIYCKNPSLDTKYIRNMCSTLEISDAQVAELNAVFDALLGHIKQLQEQDNRKLLRVLTTKTHFLTCAYIQYKAIAGGTDNMMEWIKKFFAMTSKGVSSSGQYNAACQAGSSKAEKVDDRITVAMWDYNFFLKQDHH